MLPIAALKLDENPHRWAFRRAHMLGEEYEGHGGYPLPFLKQQNYSFMMLGNVY